jgi:hypothetical protein
MTTLREHETRESAGGRRRIGVKGYALTPRTGNGAHGQTRPDKDKEPP